MLELVAVSLSVDLADRLQTRAVSGVQGRDFRHPSGSLAVVQLSSYLINIGSIDQSDLEVSADVRKSRVLVCWAIA